MVLFWNWLWTWDKPRTYLLQTDKLDNKRTPFQPNTPLLLTLTKTFEWNGLAWCLVGKSTRSVNNTYGTVANCWEQPLDQQSQLGFVLGQTCCLVDLIGRQNKGTSVHKIYVHATIKSWTFSCSQQQLIWKISYLEQVLPARKLARGGARPGLGTMSTSDQNLDVSKQNSKRRHDIDQNKDKNQDQYYKLDEYLHDHCKKR